MKASFSFVPTPSADATRTGAVAIRRHLEEAAEAANLGEHTRSERAARQ